MTQNEIGTVQNRYTGIAIILHWLVALLIAANLLLIWFVDHWPEGWVRLVIDTHKSIGITVLGLVLLRLLWRFGHAPPPLPRNYARLERRLAPLAHAALYTVMLTLPLSGWLHDSAWKDAASHPMTLFGVVPWPRIGLVMNLPPDLKERLHGVFGLAHTAFGYTLYALFTLHLGATLKHQYRDRHPDLQRMLPRL